MSGQSIFDKELAALAHECFERANSLHWSLEKDAGASSVCLVKHFHGLSFMTNGCNYWFPKSASMDIKDYAALAVLDYFNCQVDKQPFRSLTNSTIVREGFASSAELWTYLSKHAPTTPTTSLRRLQAADLDSLIKRAPEQPFVGLADECDPNDRDYLDYDESHLEDPCCFMHTYPLFNPWKSKDVMEIFDKCCNYTRGKMLCAPIIMLGQEVVLNDENIQIVGDKIHLLQDIDKQALPPLNFAACWGDVPMPEAFITLDKEIPVPKLLVPPIQFHEFQQGFQLTVDFFRNDWMVDVDAERAVPVPILTEKPVEEEENPFFEKLVDPDEDLVDALEELD
jgi:hypothetical protein